MIPSLFENVLHARLTPLRHWADSEVLLVLPAKLVADDDGHEDRQTGRHDGERDGPLQTTDKGAAQRVASET